MTSDEKRVSDDKLREIIDGCKGVTPGPWESDYLKSDGFASYEVTDPNNRSVADAFNAGVIEIHEEDGRSWDEQGRKNMAHIARLDPETVAAICSELLSRRSHQEADGWRLVPVAPTEAMTAAGWIDKEDVTPAEIWASMLAAAPQSTEGK